MQIQLIIALAIAIPVILFPAAFVWYLNLGGMLKAVREARTREALEEKALKQTVTTK
jgi:hypothetical protein